MIHYVYKDSLLQNLKKSKFKNKQKSQNYTPWDFNTSKFMTHEI